MTLKWRCRIGWHYPAFWAHYVPYPDEPPEEWWWCAECGVEALPLADRFWLRVQRHERLYEAYIWLRWRERL